MPEYNVNEGLLRQIYNCIRWQRNFRVTGAKEFRNTPDSCTVSIGDAGGSAQTPLPELTPVTLAKTSGSDGTSSAAPSWVYTATNLAGVQLATGLAPQGTRPKGKTHVATRGWLRLVSGSWQLWAHDEKPNFGAC